MHAKLNDGIQFIKGVGPKRKLLLGKLGIHTVWDALNHLPRGYEDRSAVKTIAQLKVGERATFRANVDGVESLSTRSGRSIVKVRFRDPTGTITAVWFNPRYWKAETYQAGREMLVTGKVDYYEGPQIVSPQCEPTDAPEEAGFGQRILPEYPLTEALSQMALRKFLRRVVEEYADLVDDPLPHSLREERRLVGLSDAYRNIHFPETADMAREARRRLAYDEFLLLELGMAMRRRVIRQEDKGHAFRITDEVDRRILRLFPFPLTGAQERAIAEIRADLESPRPMNRMLQGDVGSGKTVVALYALLVSVANGFQAAIMAPTEVLAEQHYQTFSRYLAHGRVRTELFAGSRSTAERRKALARLAAGEVDLAVGTHALVQPDVEFRDLGLVVVDEQHKFGVLQRANLRQKGKHPDVLVMTATPIPRTLSLTVFGDLDISVLDEMPPGRRPVKTFWAPPEKRDNAYDFIARRLREREQAFIVYPLVEESEKLDLKAAVDAADHLQKDEFRDFRVGLLHGRMTTDQKNEAMGRFRTGDCHILVSTIVIEVGIDVPNASIMVVEHAERFGLAQLHQLRGRIGRGAHTHQAWFILFGDPKTDEARARLKVLCSTTDGFRIAEEDLRLRGPGEFFGTRQHGLPEIRVGDIMSDLNLLRTARRDAFKLIAEDPDLSAAPMLREKVMEKFHGRLDLIRVG